ncbi:MAG: stage II sporulation protein M [Pseudomonadales bacterium]|nr:stage II sporulation protein M [Pseudomonadales bacterium]
MTITTEQTLARWLDGRLEAWREIDRLLAKRPRQRTLEEARRLLAAYRSLGRDLALARREMPEARTTAALGALFGRLHAEISAPASSWRDGVAELYRTRIPAAMTRLRTELVLVTTLFFVAALAGWICVNLAPETVELVLGDAAIARVEGGGLWTDDLHGVVPASQLSTSIMTNNIMVTIWAVLLGLFFGFGTLWIITLNGVMLGAVFAFTGRHGVADELARFVLAHGIVEISVILLGGAMGMRLGLALARPGLLGRAESLRAEAAALLPLLAVAVPALVGCGVIEGYVSPDPDIGWLPRLLIGLGWMMLFLAVLAGLRGVRLLDRREDPAFASDPVLAPEPRIAAP